MRSGIKAVASYGNAMRKTMAYNKTTVKEKDQSMYDTTSASFVSAICPADIAYV